VSDQRRKKGEMAESREQKKRSGSMSRKQAS
jgi:hypothetical protein